MKKLTRVDGRCVKEYFKKQTIFWLIFLCATVIYCMAIIVGTIIQKKWNTTEFGIAVFCGIFALIISSIFFFRINKAVRMANDHAFDALYEFNDDCFLRKAIVNDEQVSESKISYSDVVCYKVSENYIYLVLFSKNFYPVDKDDQIESFLVQKNIARK